MGDRTDRRVLPDVAGARLRRHRIARHQRGIGGRIPLANPGIISIPAGFLLGWLGTITFSDPAAVEAYDEIELRSLTGAGAEQPVLH